MGSDRNGKGRLTSDRFFVPNSKSSPLARPTRYCRCWIFFSKIAKKGQHKAKGQIGDPRGHDGPEHFHGPHDKDSICFRLEFFYHFGTSGPPETPTTKGTSKVACLLNVINRNREERRAQTEDLKSSFQKC
jgi:hypothetical protein